ncbi:hypothetical protein, partial [Klebsiella aerogenes]|uniref:hypothetical protein n=1 Tax=Klebsiella aerogenes TaxID=548 RepID=UPI001952DB7B
IFRSSIALAMGSVAAVIERLMCDMTVDVAAICEAHGFSTDHLAGSLASLAAIEVAGPVCARVSD